MADRPLRPATHRRLGKPLPHQLANAPRAHPDAEAEASFPPRGTSGISPSFDGLSRSSGQVTHVLLTRSRLCPGASPGSSLHLHVLGTPPAFVLSQDQTLREVLHEQNSHSAHTPEGMNREIVTIQNRGTSTLRHPQHDGKTSDPQKDQDALFKNRASVKEARIIEPGRTPLLQEMHACCCVFKDRRALRTRCSNAGGAHRTALVRAENISTSLGPDEVRPSNSGPALRRCSQRLDEYTALKSKCVAPLPSEHARRIASFGARTVATLSSSCRVLRPLGIHP